MDVVECLRYSNVYVNTEIFQICKWKYLTLFKSISITEPLNSIIYYFIETDDIQTRCW